MAEQNIMSAVETRLKAEGLTVPTVAKPVAVYVPAVTVGNFVYTSGQLPLENGALELTGKVGKDVTPDEAKAEARKAALNVLAAIKAEIGDLDRVTRVVKVTGYVASAPEFTGQPGVINGASELFGLAFGDAGVHARSAVGVAALPLDAAVEVDVVVEFR